MDPIVLVVIAGVAFYLLTQTNTTVAQVGTPLSSLSPAAQRQAVTSPGAQLQQATNTTAQDFNAAGNLATALGGVISSIAKTIPMTNGNLTGPGGPPGSAGPNDPVNTQSTNNQDNGSGGSNYPVGTTFSDGTVVTAPNDYSSLSADTSANG